MMEEKIPRYWRLKRKYNTLSVNYDVLKRDSEYKDRVITRLKNEIELLKEENKKWQQPQKVKKKLKRRRHITSVKKKKKI